jgi:hypothetical protein
LLSNPPDVSFWGLAVENPTGVHVLGRNRLSLSTPASVESAGLAAE